MPALALELGVFGLKFALQQPCQLTLMSLGSWQQLEIAGAYRGLASPRRPHVAPRRLTPKK